MDDEVVVVLPEALEEAPEAAAELGAAELVALDVEAVELGAADVGAVEAADEDVALCVAWLLAVELPALQAASAMVPLRRIPANAVMRLVLVFILVVPFKIRGKL